MTSPASNTPMGNTHEQGKTVICHSGRVDLSPAWHRSCSFLASHALSAVRASVMLRLYEFIVQCCSNTSRACQLLSHKSVKTGAHLFLFKGVVSWPKRIPLRRPAVTCAGKDATIQLTDDAIMPFSHQTRQIPCADCYVCGVHCRLVGAARVR